MFGGSIRKYIPMDLFQAIKALYEEKRRIDEIIEHLETLSSSRRGITPESGKRRGRKKMDEAERVEVSRRMKNYWAERRKIKRGEAGE